MANSFVLLADLNACQCSFTVEVIICLDWARVTTLTGSHQMRIIRPSSSEEWAPKRGLWLLSQSTKDRCLSG
ncbi:hypothetical protein F2Q69_00048956 [Brassica cretica]|uniref:Uncharacterized protein n=1 Tax=Brassica cretica TaxID=69181 RepID=A0A8S9PFM7_BRACR|nr:hypothetical protein F2Q69_00048956 [Brassica cretica]